MGTQHRWKGHTAPQKPTTEDTVTKVALPGQHAGGAKGPAGLSSVASRERDLGLPFWKEEGLRNRQGGKGLQATRQQMPMPRGHVSKGKWPLPD